MQVFLKNIDNKEIFIKILHHSVDYLIGNEDDKSTCKLCHKFGFLSPDDFLSTIKGAAKAIQNSYCDGSVENEILFEFSNINHDMQLLVLNVMEARRQELIKYLLRRGNSQNKLYLESFDWDIRLIMGASSYADNYRILVTSTFNCSNSKAKVKTIHCQLARTHLDKLIATLEEALSKSITFNSV